MSWIKQIEDILSPETVLFLIKQPRSLVIERLGEIAASYPDKSTESSRIYKTLVSLLQEDRTMNDIPLEPKGYIQPSEYNVLLTDVRHNDLVGDISARLGVKYLQEASEENSITPISGILYGANNRPMVNLVISVPKFKKHVNVIFLIDTCSPCLYICEAAIKALGFTDTLPNTFNIAFRGRNYEAVMSPLVVDGKEGHYKEINLLGATFLRGSRTKLALDYGQLELKMETK